MQQANANSAVGKQSEGQLELDFFYIDYSARYQSVTFFFIDHCLQGLQDITRVTQNNLIFWTRCSKDFYNHIAVHDEQLPSFLGS